MMHIELSVLTLSGLNFRVEASELPTKGEGEMRVSVVVMDDSGQAFGGEANLKLVETATPTPRQSVTSPGTPELVDFDLPIRPFMKRFGTNLSGPKRFVLLLAHMAHGAIGTPVQISELQRLWKTMVGIIGDFNTAYPTRAKDSGWVDSPRPGVYTLLSGWTEIL
jgi:hypothetical protein